MPSKPPFIRQERSETCMLACLRMVLAWCGTEISEAELVERVSLDEGGLDPAALASLAAQFGLQAEARQLDLNTVVELVARDQFPIILVDRSFLDREFSIHAVIPIRFTAHYVQVLDPLRGERRLSRRKFFQAHRRIGLWGIVWQSVIPKEPAAPP